MVKHTQTIRRQIATNCLSVFDHFVKLALKLLSFISGSQNFVLFRVTGRNLEQRIDFLQREIDQIR